MTFTYGLSFDLLHISFPYFYDYCSHFIEKKLRSKEFKWLTDSQPVSFRGRIGFFLTALSLWNSRLKWAAPKCGTDYKKIRRTQLSVPMSFCFLSALSSWFLTARHNPCCSTVLKVRTQNTFHWAQKAPLIASGSPGISGVLTIPVGAFREDLWPPGSASSSVLSWWWQQSTQGAKHLAKLFPCFIVFNLHTHIRILVISLSHFIVERLRA